ncbi:hypothetical protein HDK64DRAFT_328408 [Phyllosticta capitalensis]
MERDQNCCPPIGVGGTRIENNLGNSGVILSEMRGGSVIVRIHPVDSGLALTSPTALDPEKRAAIMKWLSDLDHAGVHDQYYDKVAPGTSGAGKTCLASMIVQFILNIPGRLGRSHTKIQVAFLYLTYKEQPSVGHLLGSLARQLLGKSSKAVQLQQELWDREHEQGSALESPPTVASLNELLVALTSDHNTYIIVDALDELDSGNREELIRRLSRINVNLLITSRYFEGFKSMAKRFRIVNVKAQREDIDMFVDQKIVQSSRLSAFILRDPSLEEMIKIKVNQRADGSFLMVRFHMEALAASLTSTAVLNALEILPSDPQSTYRNTLKRINNQEPQKRDWAIKILGWVHHAVRQLNVQELRHALATEPGSLVFDHGDMLLEEDILGFCCGLIEIDQPLLTVKLVHYTTHEFFDRIKHEFFPEFHAHIALACATYLSFERLERHEGSEDASIDPRDYEDAKMHVQELNEFKTLKRLHLDTSHYFADFSKVVLDRLFTGETYFNSFGVKGRLPYMMKLLLYPFVKYAAEFLHEHFSETTADRRSTVEAQICILLRNRPKRMFYAELIRREHLRYDIRAPFFLPKGYDKVEDFHPQNRAQDSAIYLAAALGSSDLVKHFCRNDTPVGVRHCQFALSLGIELKMPSLVTAMLYLEHVVDLKRLDVTHLLRSAPDAGFRKELSQFICRLSEDCRNIKKQTKRPQSGYALQISSQARHTISCFEHFPKWEGIRMPEGCMELEDPYTSELLSQRLITLGRPKFTLGGLDPNYFYASIMLLSAANMGDEDEISNLVQNQRANGDWDAIAIDDNFSTIFQLLLLSLRLCFFDDNTNAAMVLLDHGVEVFGEDLSELYSTLKPQTSLLRMSFDIVPDSLDSIEKRRDRNIRQLRLGQRANTHDLTESTLFFENYEAVEEAFEIFRQSQSLVNVPNTIGPQEQSKSESNGPFEPETSPHSRGLAELPTDPPYRAPIEPSVIDIYGETGAILSRIHAEWEARHTRFGLYGEPIELSIGIDAQGDEVELKPKTKCVD